MNEERAKSFAGYLLASRMYTCDEIYKRLIRKGCDDETAEKVVAEFCSAGILNDEKYAEMYIYDALNIHMKGFYRIKQELLRKGIAASVIERAAEGMEDDAEDRLLEYARQRFGDRVFTDYREIEKAKAHLLRRGYSFSDINRCFRALDIKVSRGDDD